MRVRVPTDLLERPEWQQQAACRGMASSWWNAGVDEQLAVCHGTTAPWSVPCPVRQECGEWFIRRCVETDGMQAAYDNQMVHGGKEPAELLTIAKAVRRKKMAQRGVQAPPDSVR